MQRRLRAATGDYVYHALNRATLSDSPADHEAFVRVLNEAPRHVPMRLLAWRLMPNH